MTQYYRLTLEEAIAQYDKNWITATALLYYYLKIRLKPGWKITLHQREITKELGIPKSSFYRAIENLGKEGLIHWEAPNGVVITLSKNKSHEWDSIPTDETPSPTNETPSPTNETPSPTNGTETPLKPIPSKESGNLSDSYQIFINSLSDSEREIFLEFGRKKAANLPHRPELPDKWIAANFTELYKYFLASSAGRAAKQEAIARKYDWENDPRLMDWLHKAYWEGHPWAVEDEFEREERLAFLMWAQKTNAYAGRIADEPA